ncbi:MAG TPA: nuclear transport factor 2 family protein [Steroidobacteraceae bacterium]|nr:nuclear transport factor 2 family protein [Steroidobacteraceae bacterium]
MHELIDLEEQGWRALSTQGDAAAKFYACVLRDDAVMLFPGGLRIEGRDSILQSLAAQPWRSFQIEDSRVISLGEDSAVVIYKVTAQRDGSDPYAALISSTYVNEKGWRLVVHQQTPQ